MFDESSNNNMFSDSVRQDFCFACCLHGLLEESSIEGLLGDIPMQSLPAGGRYAKDDLVQQCLSDPEKAEGLIDELEHMDGNVGAVSQAITEVRIYLHTIWMPLLTVLGHRATMQQQRNNDSEDAMQSSCTEAIFSRCYASFRQTYHYPTTYMRSVRQLAL
jgi:hypothetical protein